MPKTLFELFPLMRAHRQMAAAIPAEAPQHHPAVLELADRSDRLTAAIVALGMTTFRAWELFDVYETPLLMARLTTLDINLEYGIKLAAFHEQGIKDLRAERDNIARQLGLA